eukprot:141924-Chlamydomonas_euryale.AAC.4
MLSPAAGLDGPPMRVDRGKSGLWIAASKWIQRGVGLLKYVDLLCKRLERPEVHGDGRSRARSQV